MTSFLDGPAAGVCLALRRAPLFLRVVRSAAKGEWDALDQLADEPRPREAVFCYRRVTPVGRVIFIRPGGRFALADYRHVADGPPGAIMRDRDAWREWCLDRAGGEGVVELRTNT